MAAPGWSANALAEVHLQFGTPPTSIELDIFRYEHELAKHDNSFMLLHDDTCPQCRAPAPPSVELVTVQPPQTWEQAATYPVQRNPNLPPPVYRFDECAEKYITHESFHSGDWVRYDKKSWFTEFVLEDQTVVYFLVNKKQRAAISNHRSVYWRERHAYIGVYVNNAPLRPTPPLALYQLTYEDDKYKEATRWAIGDRADIYNYKELRLNMLKRKLAFNNALTNRQGGE